jgi:hypothetical protein
LFYHCVISFIHSLTARIPKRSPVPWARFFRSSERPDLVVVSPRFALSSWITPTVLSSVTSRDQSARVIFSSLWRLSVRVCTYICLYHLPSVLSDTIVHHLTHYILGLSPPLILYFILFLFLSSHSYSPTTPLSMYALTNNSKKHIIDRKKKEKSTRSSFAFVQSLLLQVYLTPRQQHMSIHISQANSSTRCLPV